MARLCPVTKKTVLAGNNVSHANNRTRRRFLPNLQSASLYSEILQKAFSFRITTNAIRTIEHKGGLDAYVQATAPTKLAPEFRNIKKLVAKKTTAQTA